MIGLLRAAQQVVGLGAVDPVKEHDLLLRVVGLVNEDTPQQLDIGDAKVDLRALRHELDLIQECLQGDFVGELTREDLLMVVLLSTRCLLVNLHALLWVQCFHLLLDHVLVGTHQLDYFVKVLYVRL